MTLESCLVDIDQCTGQGIGYSRVIELNRGREMDYLDEDHESAVGIVLDVASEGIGRLLSNIADLEKRLELAESNERIASDNFDRQVKECNRLSNDLRKYRKNNLKLKARIAELEQE
jgi:hypothetical protein